MLFTEQLPTFPTINTAIRSVKPFSTHGLGTGIIVTMSLPVLSCNNLVRVWLSRRRFGRRSRLDGYGADGKALVVIRFKDIKSFEFLIEDRQRLELLRLDHLGFKPVFHFILPFVLEVLVDIVKVPGIRQDSVSGGNGFRTYSAGEVSPNELLTRRLFAMREGALVTISSLQMGHMSLELAAAAAVLPGPSPLSKEIREVKS
jgi:hypothetical protein